MTIISSALAINIAAYSAQTVPTDSYSIDLIHQQSFLEREAKQLEKNGDFDAAIKKYEKAIDLDLRIYGGSEGRPMAKMATIYQKKCDFVKAGELVGRLFKAHPKHELYNDWNDELAALIEYQRSGAGQSVFEYIGVYKKKYVDNLPPERYSFQSLMNVVTLIRLYDTIGDYDEGIKFIDELLSFMYNQNPDVQRVETVQKAKELMDQLNAQKLRSKAHAYKILREHLLVREAFEQDKAEGKKGSMKEGKPGRATLALIQSDFFPW